MRFLHLTSPLMHGADVESAQRLLHYNRFADFEPGPVDGQYGPGSAAATRRAQYWVGFRSMSGVYGPHLDDYLAGKKIGPLMAIRRRIRLARAKTTLGDRAIAKARTYVGVEEHPPESNIVLFSTWYGLIGPWCAMFVTYCLVSAGSNLFARGSRYAYVPYILDDARRGGLGLQLTSSPRHGDLALYDWDRDGVADHVEFFDRFVGAGAQFTSVGGNTTSGSSGDQSNGGQVAARTRNRSDVIAFVHVWK